MNGNGACCWHGSIAAFLLLEKTGWLSALQDKCRQRMQEPAGPAAVAAWDLAFDILHKELKQLVQINPAIDQFAIVFGISRTGDYGPDAVILGPGVFVLAFRDCEAIVPADCDRVAALARDLKERHAGSRGHAVVPVLVLARARELVERYGDVLVISPDRIVGVFTIEAELEDGPLINAAKWLAAGYGPGPS